MNLENEVRDQGRLIARLEAENERRDAVMEQLDKDVKEIQQVLRNTATKEDVMQLGSRFDGAINGILREAIAAVPPTHANAIAASANDLASEDNRTNRTIMWATVGSFAVACAMMIFVFVHG